MAVDELRFMGGRQFDPVLVEAFVEVVDEYVATFGKDGDVAYRAAVQDSTILKRQDNIKRLLSAPDEGASRASAVDRPEVTKGKSTPGRRQ
jgi:hypothetical protein